MPCFNNSADKQVHGNWRACYYSGVLYDTVVPRSYLRFI